MKVRTVRQIKQQQRHQRQQGTFASIQPTNRNEILNGRRSNTKNSLIEYTKKRHKHVGEMLRIKFALRN